MASRSGVAPGWGPGRANGRRWGLPLTANGDFLLSLDIRAIYRHMAAPVDSVMIELGQGPFGPMASGMPGMQMPDVGKVLEETDKSIGTL